MRVFSALAAAVACVGASTDCDLSVAECASEEVSLLQAARKHRNEPEPVVELPALQNQNKNCWHECHHEGGLCDFCGTRGVCCREGFADDPEECGGLGGEWERIHTCRFPVVKGPGWTLIVQYGDDGYIPTSNAAGEPSESHSQFAKLSDAAINALPSSGDAAYDYYMLSSSADGLFSRTTRELSGRSTIFLRVTGAFNDEDIVYGFTHWEVCTAATFEECTEWFAAGNRAADGRAPGIDTYTGATDGVPTGATLNDCDRWYTGKSNAWCWVDGRSDVPSRRCWTTGGCRDRGGTGGLLPWRTDVKMYKYT